MSNRSAVTENRDSKKKRNATENRDATKTARGFSYQRQYAISLLIVLIINIKNTNNNDTIEIIEEGKLDGSVYEDITIIHNNNKYITYQIKYHTTNKSFSFIPSNSDLFKTIKNKHNLNVKELHFIVSKNTNTNTDTFDEIMNDWKNGKLTKEEIYNAIIQLNKNDNSEVAHYRECKKFLEENPTTEKIDYIGKITIEEGFTYDELIKNIENNIKNIFNIDDEIIVFYIRYYVFELFEQNYFRDENNKPLKINNIYQEINLKFKKTFTDDERDKLFNDTIKQVFDKIKSLLVLMDNPEELKTNNNENLIKELTLFVNAFNTKFETKHFLCFLDCLHVLYKKNNNKNTAELYKNICIKLCRHLYKHKQDNLTDEHIDNIVCSISTYYNHSIKNEINLNKSKGFKNVLSTDELEYVKKIRKEIQS
jgi:hypothetical protein